jgi:hypothetical protein
VDGRRHGVLLVIMGEMDQGAIFDTFFVVFLFSGVYFSLFSSYAFLFGTSFPSLLSFHPTPRSLLDECVAKT